MTDETQDMGNVSDGYHTFNELYEHRHMLFLLLMAAAREGGVPTWVDSADMDGWFLAGIDTRKGQLSYHLPDRLLRYAQKQVTPGYEREPYDGYTSADVLKRLQATVGYDDLVEPAA